MSMCYVRAVKYSVMFDMDGVLVDSNAAHFKAFQKMGEILGKPFTREHLEQTIGMHNSSIFPFWLGPGLSPERVVELADQKERLYREFAVGKLREIPGATRLVRELHELGVPLAVGSSGPRANVELAVRTLGLAQYFRVLVTGDDVLRGKPAPDIFLKAAAGLGVEPSSCVVIEDAPQGIQAGLAAGMRVVAVATSRPAEFLGEAHRVFEGMGEIDPSALDGVFWFSE